MTDRTTSPSQDAHGTAREINTSPDRVTLSKEVEEVVANLQRVRSTHVDGDVYRAFIDAAADLLTRLSAERDRLEKDCRRWHKAAMDAGVITLVNGALKFSQQERAERAETERDSECERAASLGRLYEAECARAINAESEISALKTTINELALEHPFTPAQWVRLHATLTGEQK